MLSYREVGIYTYDVIDRIPITNRSKVNAGLQADQLPASHVSRLVPGFVSFLTPELRVVLLAFRLHENPGKIFYNLFNTVFDYVFGVTARLWYRFMVMRDIYYNL